MTQTSGAISRSTSIARTTKQQSRLSTYWLRAALFALASVCASFYLLPIVLLVLTGLKSYDEVNLYQMWTLPRTLSFQSFADAWKGSPSFAGLEQNFVNSFIVTIPATLLSAFLGAMNGFVLSKWQFRGSNLIFGLLLFGLFIPYQSILIPLVRVLNAMGLYGSLHGLIFVHVVYGIPITTLIFRNYYATVPNELLEAAQIDGAHIIDLFFRIMLPIAAPAFVVAIIWQFTNIWNDFLFALTVTNNPANQPVTVALNNLAGSFSVEWNVQFAGALIAAAPTLLIYIFLGRYFVRGLLAGSVKG
jgi:glucose/mannose transport system permease protein